ncbi:RNA polymerase sigma factor [Zavarzinella formosa]|uniref:RNA polymerase sigma factor n=1 Tax=Zavarzinella formosa TaxID=360055 RepID=UPI0002E8D499|nr:sigma-70 family RNA polymerase sigma factor [Zavarzinella formosa]
MDPDLLGYLIDRYSAALILYARPWCRCPEDVVQEVFIRFARQRETPVHPAAWLYRSVRNAAISAGRSERRRTNHEGNVAAKAVLLFVPPDDVAGLDATAASEALTKLPLDQREVIVAHLWGGLTFEQIAELTGGSAATAWRRYSAGLVSLRKMMGAPCKTPPEK